MQQRDLISAKILRHQSESKLQMYRNLAYGGAGVSLLLIALLAQIWEKTTALEICLYSSVASLPFWIFIGTIYEYYILLGKHSYAHYRTLKSQIIITLSCAAAGLLLLTAIGALLYSIKPASIIFLAISSLLVLVLSFTFTSSLSSALKENERNDT
jgi:hypothetical protein